MAYRMPRNARRVRGRLKFCPYCDQWRDTEEFTPHPGGQGGLDNRCNWCRSAYRREKRAEARQQMRRTVRCDHGYYRDAIRCVTCDSVEAAAARKPLPVITPEAVRAPNRGARGYTCSLCKSPGHSKPNCPERVGAHPRTGKPNPNLKFRPVPAEFAEEQVAK